MNLNERIQPPPPPNIESEFNEAIEYALFPGGKRLRPVLTLLGAEIVGVSLRGSIRMLFQFRLTFIFVIREIRKEFTTMHFALF